MKQNVREHKHEKHSEQVFVIEGSAIMWVSGKEYAIKPGDILYIPIGALHKVKVTSAVPLKVISFQSPEFKGEDRVYINN